MSEQGRAPKVTVRESPAKLDATVLNAAGPFEVRDALGRTLMVRRIRALDRFRIAKVVGAEQATNLGVVGIAWSCAAVVSIDGDPVDMPTNDKELEALIQRLDDDGLNAVQRVYEDHGWNEQQVDKAAAKN